jgi:mannose/fructose/N-acetylgalactosamine-specific phosphotransferase system component IIC
MEILADVLIGFVVATATTVVLIACAAFWYLLASFIIGEATEKFQKWNRQRKVDVAWKQRQKELTNER